MKIVDTLALIFKTTYPVLKELLKSGQHFELRIQGKQSKLIKIDHITADGQKITGEKHYEA